MYKTKKIALYLTCLLGTHSWSSPDTALPPSWFTLPGLARMENSSLGYVQNPSAAATDAVDRLVTTHTRAWDALANQEYSFLSTSTGANPWHLEFLALDLGVSAQGALGVLFMQGSSTINLYWRRHHAGVSATSATETSADLALSGELSQQDLAHQIEPIAKAVLATGRINNEAAFRKNLWKRAYAFNALAGTLAAHAPASWETARYRLDLQVTGSGMVAPGITAGGLVKLRFDWLPSPQHMPYRVSVEPDRKVQELKEKFGRFLDALDREMDNVNFDNQPAPKPLALNQIVLSLAVTANGDWGIASAGGGVFGSLYLRKQPALPRTFSNEPLRVVSAGTNLSSLPSDALKKGLEKAVSIGNYFAERAIKNQGTSWDVDQLRVQFALSIGGTVGIVTITEQTAIQLVFNRT